MLYTAHTQRCLDAKPGKLREIEQGVQKLPRLTG